ncbi:unnamed protein product [Ixodes hexagonus]
MEDVDQIVRRREIRKKKILENSDARWKKIVGQERRDSLELIKDDGTPPRLPTPGPRLAEQQEELPLPTAPCDAAFSSSEEQSRRSYSFGEASASPTDLWRDEAPPESLTFLEATASPRLSSLGESRTRSLDETANGAPRLGLSEPQQRSASYSFPKKVSDTESRSYSRCKLDVREDDGMLALLLDCLGSCGPSLVRAWLLSLVATCVRLWLALGTTCCGVHTVLLPFCLLEAAIYSFPTPLTKASTPQRGLCSPLTLLTAALMLCGIAPKTTSRVTACLQLLTDLAVDFAVYTFSFVVFHVIWDDWVG